MTAHSFLTVLSPIEYRADDPHGRMAAIRDTLLTHEQNDSPFRDCPMVHMARVQILEDLTPPMGDMETRGPQTRYLLFIVDLDGGVDDFLDCLYRVNPGFVKAIWGRCLGYPEYEGAVFFRRYIHRCMFGHPLGYPGFPSSVQEILRALTLKQKLADWAAGHQGVSDADLQAAWRHDRRHLINPHLPKPGKL